jgi:PAS domain S-box-containing protein
MAFQFFYNGKIQQVTKIFIKPDADHVLFKPSNRSCPIMMNPQVTLFSETTRSGVITFVNNTFCEVSKYKREELMGKPHNIIRHPDMPKELFHYMWRTISSGNTFRGVIKNQAKDGSHYWVKALIKPQWNSSKDQIEKYVSFRHLIEDEMEAVRLFQEQFKNPSLTFGK